MSDEARRCESSSRARTRCAVRNTSFALLLLSAMCEGVTVGIEEAVQADGSAIPHKVVGLLGCTQTVVDGALAAAVHALL